MEVEVKRAFIGAGCNRIVNNVSWGACDLVSFGAQNAVAIFCPKTAQILTTLPGHNAYVNCTHWLPSSKFAFKASHLERHYLLSGDADGTIILWEFSLADKKWRNVLHVPENHKKGVTCISAIMISNTDVIFASSSSDGLVNMWEIILPSSSGGECKLSILDSIFVGRKPMVAISLAELPGSGGHLTLAMGGLDNKIHIYSGERTGKFVHACEVKGHTDWIRSLDFSLPIYANGETSSLLLVSSSQDKGIRIWKMALRESLGNNRKEETSLSSYIKGPIFSAGSTSYQISLESLLIGHEDWVYSVEWQPPQSSSIDGIECYQPQSILSASMDKTMMIWQPEKTTGIWMNMVTVGELSHCALGFYGGHWSPGGNSILAHGYGGSFHLWKNVGTDFDDWKPQKVPSGHFAEVSDISWAREGEYLLSVSHDQTSRVFSAWGDESSLENGGFWHEIARPQVHGHDINCVTIIRGKGNHRFVSGADEKVARVFEAPLSFLKTLNHATSHNSSFTDDVPANVQILGANMSALGLSQKPIYVQASSTESKEKSNIEGIDTLETIPEAVPVELTEPPIEEQLGWHTLWPESHKLYGHGNELFAVCGDHEGNLIASSCKAQSASVAEIWLWQVSSWKAVGRLHSHTLTVTQLEFSHDNNFLLSVSRDRHFSIFAIKQTGPDEINHQLVVRQEAHKRIIWSCSWNPFGHEFATGSRDKTVKIWQLENGSSVKLLLTLPMFKSSITALSWLGIDSQKNDGLLAVGMETGLIELWSLSIAVPNAALLVRFDPLMCHVSAVQRLRWRSTKKSEDSTSMQLASCGADHCVRIFQVDV
ncbi:RNA polymerase II elongator complex, subunit ELP2, WD repeat superfamily [Handroanthus impetiginosus]|uniref:Elongator complex protein 2 n=1 Tax=Handroanthus impetiginosus TaxID=429701 RepID=A0A2G9I1Q9_9LAMI|nr:RNA polymerase II elongator complex, subunit ELP2, WD repeat superfamily [Handroanthus impetiginosus]